MNVRSEHEQHSSHESIRREHSFETLRVEGTLPQDLNGTLFRNGPGLYELFEQPYAHMFEGDGAVSAVRFEGGRALGAVRVVQSAGLLEEKKAGKPLFGFNAPWWKRFPRMIQMKSKNTANTSVMYWQERLFALMEGAKPTELSTEDLSTIGETDLGMIPMTFSAHPHAVPDRKALYNFGMEFGRQTKINMFELPFQGKARHLGDLHIDYPVMLHDFMATENHLVFFISPLKMRIWRAMLALGPFGKLFYWDPNEGVDVWIVPIDQPDRAVRFQTDPFFQFHFANGFERKGELLIDFVRYPDFQILDELKAKEEKRGVPEDWGQLTRAILDPKKKTIRQEALWDESCEFPKVHPNREAKEYRYIWMTTEPHEEADGTLEAYQLLGLDLQTHRVQRFKFEGQQEPSEPIFVPRPQAQEENDGYLLSLIYDPNSHTSHVAIFDAKHIEDGPQARVWFDQHIPTTFHGTWVPL